MDVMYFFVFQRDLFPKRSAPFCNCKCNKSICLKNALLLRGNLFGQVGPPSGVLKGKEPNQWRPKDVANTVLIDR